MNIRQSFRENYDLVKKESGANGGPVAQAAAMLVLAEVLQGTTFAHSLMVENDNRRPVVTENR